MDDIAADFCSVLLGVIHVLDDLVLLFCVFTFLLEFVFSFSAAYDFSSKLGFFLFPDKNRWWCHSVLTYLTHPHPIFRCIRCHKYYMKCHYHLPHDSLYFPFLYPCDPAESQKHAQTDSSSTPCQSTCRNPRFIFKRFYQD